MASLSKHLFSLRRYAWLKISLPIALSVVLFAGVVLLVQMPSFHDTLLEKRKEGLKTNTQIAWKIVQSFYIQGIHGETTMQEAKEGAIHAIAQLRFGPEGKDYFWINDTHPRMVMHPYLPELDGTDLTDYEDHAGKRLFVEMVAASSETGGAFVPYMWQWQDDSRTIAKKISYVKRFEPWRWVIGTGAYLKDIDEDMAAQTRTSLIATFSVLGFVVLLSLITVLQGLKASARIRESEATMRELFQQSGEMLVLMDLDGKIIHLNNAAMHIAELPQDGTPCCPTWELLLQHACGEASEFIREAIRSARGGAASSLGAIRFDVDGQERHVSMKVLPIRNEAGVPLFLLADGVDVTEMRNAQVQLEALNRELEARVAQRTQELEESLATLQQTQKTLVESEKMAALGSLVAGVAHEINTPLGLGVTNATFLKEQVKKIKTQYEAGKFTQGEFETFLANADEATRSMLVNLRRGAEIIKSFKQVAVDQEGETIRTFALLEYLDEVMISLKPGFKHTRHEMKIDCPGDLVLTTYPGLLMQILSNLTMNSLLHGFEGVEEGTITLRARREEERIVLVYSDDGRGMTPEQEAKVFDPFFTTKQGQGGTGLGMHIVYNLVTQKLCGTIGLKTSPGNGVLFTLTFPVENDGTACKLLGHGEG